MIVYESPLSPYAQKVKIALREKNIDFEVTYPEGLGGGPATGVLGRVNPRGEVPCLIDGDLAVFDSTIILEYLEDKYPSPSLIPASPADRARSRMIEDICDTHYEAINWGLIELRYFRRGGDLADQLRARAAEQIADIHAWLTRVVGDRDWLVGDRFSRADLSLVPFLTMSEYLGIETEVGSKLAHWRDRICARPAVAQTVGEAKAHLPHMENVGAAFARLGYKREYRDHRLEWMIASGGVQVVIDGLANDTIRFTDTKSFLAHQLR